MSERRRALGRGLGALIPQAPPPGGAPQRPVDVFFPDQQGAAAEAARAAANEAANDSAVAAAIAEATAPEATSREAADRDGVAAPGPSTEPDEAGDLGEEVTEKPAVAQAAGATSAARTPAVEAPAVEDAAVEAPAVKPAGRGANGARATAAANPTATATPSSARQQASDEPSNGHAASALEGSAPVQSGSPADGLLPVPGVRFAELPLDSITPNAQQPRQVFDEDDLAELASSIREVGVLQPIVVRSAGTNAQGEPVYELIMGERRWRASHLAGNDTVPAIIRDTAQHDMLRDALLENLHRAQLNPLEEAAAYQQLLDDFGCTHDELASRIARSRPQISNTLRLLNLPPLVQRRLAAGVLSAGHARALLGLTNGAAMERLAQRIVAEGLSVRATEEIVSLGDEPIQPELRRRPRAGEHSAALNDLASRLSDSFDTKVKIALGQRKGRINIEFASVQDLNRILTYLAPHDPGVLRHETGATD